MNIRLRRLLTFAAIGLLVTGVIWRRSRARALSENPASTQPDTQTETRTNRRTSTLSASLEFGGRTRTYLIHIPSAYDAKRPSPMVVILHGATQSDESAERMSGMSVKADRENFIAVYPNGTGRRSDDPTWNAGNCCGYAMQNHVDDIGFFRALLKVLEHDYAIDRKRIYFSGISNGAMMSYRVACEMSDEVAAISPVEGSLDGDCHPSEPVSVLIFHGTADRLVPFDGGPIPFHTGEPRNYNSVASAVQFWVKRDMCSATPNHDETTETHVDKYSQCERGTSVVLYAIQGGHHMWPGLVISGNRVPATGLIWSFFAAHPKS